MLRIFQIIKYSFYSAEFYRDVFRNIKGYAFKYFMILSVIGSLPLIILNYTAMKSIINSEELDSMIANFPKVVVSENKLDNDFSTPYVIENGGKKIAFFASNNAAVMKAGKNKYGIIFSKNLVKILIAGEYTNLKYSQVFGKENIVINAQDLQSVRSLVQNNIIIFSLIIPALLIILIKSIKNLLEFGFLSFVVKLVFARLNAKFESIFRLIVFVFYPITLIELLMFGVFGLKTVFAEIIFIIIKIGYLIFATRSLEQKNPS